MSIALVIEWVLMAVLAGVAGRLTGAWRGAGIGAICAAFWVVLVVTDRTAVSLSGPWRTVTLVAGAAVVVLMAMWAGEGWHRGTETEPPSQRNRHGRKKASDTAWVASPLRSFDQWLERYRHDADPWPEFGEFLRSLLHDTCGAVRVRLFRILSEGDMAIPLEAIANPREGECVQARKGILGYVVTSGRSYYADDPAQGQRLAELAAAERHPVVWAFTINRGTRRIGAVTVGGFADGRPRLPHCQETLAIVELMIGQFWATLGEVCRSRASTTTDPSSGLMTQEAFLEATDRAVTESYRKGEPVALAIFAVEGLRGLDDAGQWATVSSVIQQVSDLLREKVRADDCLGRFDESRFVVLLRRVDSELALLIVNQLLEKLAPVERAVSGRPAPLTFRCGIAGSGTGQPSVATLIERANEQCHQARSEKTSVSSDVMAAAAKEAARP